MSRLRRTPTPALRADPPRKGEGKGGKHAMIALSSTNVTQTEVRISRWIRIAGRCHVRPVSIVGLPDMTDAILPSPLRGGSARSAGVGVTR